MTERLHHHSPETTSHSHESHEQSLPQNERELSTQDVEHGTQEQVESQRIAVEKHAKSAHEYATPKHEAQHHHPVLINKQLKDAAFTRSITRARKKLSVPSRTFSKFIHQPVVDRASEAVGKTIARPSSLLGGSFFALIGTSALLWITRRYGYEYNYLVVILLFVTGFVVGISLEWLWRAVKNRNQL